VRERICGIFLFVVVVLPCRPLSAEDVNFTRDIRPILAKRCFACHGPAKLESGVGFHLRLLAIARSESGDRPIVPGNPDASVLLNRVTTNDKSARMPPEGQPLSRREVRLLREWIRQGAPYAKHPAFVKPTRPELPDVKRQNWGRNEIDRFILARLEGKGISPSPIADRAKLIRRLSIDLIGLLPTIAEVDAFLSDGTDQAYENAVTRLLASDHFGERWGRHWLDLARYADTFGYERDDVRPNAWRYRDWVIESMNRNQPFDQFVIDQLAGDLLDKPSLEQRIATGLHRMNIKNNESGINREDYRNRETVDRVNTTGTALLGLTIGCSQCHSHKYDPISQQEYYEFYAFFNNVEETDVEIEGTSADRDRYEQALAAYKAKKQRLAARRNLLDQMRKHKTHDDWRSSVLRTKAGQSSASTKFPQHPLEVLDIDDSLKSALAASAQSFSKAQQAKVELFWKSLESQFDDAQKAIRQLSVQQRHLPKPYMMTLSEVLQNRRPTFLLERGDFKRKGEQVFPTTPAVLNPFTARGKVPDRLDLARWIVSPDNPLTARVAVNHIWSHLFGLGIVTTLDDFGTQGEPPSHPKLLDWLAVEFVESGWDRKHFIRQIVMSETYRQTARSHPELTAIDPENRLFAKQLRFRVEAEIVRDLFLDASGLLHRRVGGPTIHPNIPQAIGNLGYKYKTRWIVSAKPERYRRGLYIHFKRTNPYPSLVMFDSPKSNLCRAKRNRSNTPLQALTTLNDPVFFECAQSLGQMLARQRTDSEARVRYAGRRCLTRSLQSREVQTLLRLFEAEKSWYEQHTDDAAELVGEYAADGVPDPETAAWVAVSRAILNLDEFVTRE